MWSPCYSRESQESSPAPQFKNLNSTVRSLLYGPAFTSVHQSVICVQLFVGSLKTQESSRKTSISALLTMSKPLTVWITINWKILKEMGIPDHLTCLLRNLYAGQEATVRTGCGTTDWFQIGKGVCHPNTPKAPISPHCPMFPIQ